MCGLSDVHEFSGIFQVALVGVNCDQHSPCFMEITTQLASNSSTIKRPKGNNLSLVCILHLKPTAVVHGPCRYSPLPSSTHREAKLYEMVWNSSSNLLPSRSHNRSWMAIAIGYKGESDDMRQLSN